MKPYLNKDVKIGVIGLGYVGLPLACLFSRHYPVTGFDTHADRIKKLNEGNDCTGEIPSNELSALLADKLVCTNCKDDLTDCNVYVICVPTPVDSNNHPDLSPLKNASELAGSYLRYGDIVIYESSVYPGCTEKECVPILSARSGLTYNEEFGVGYSPERINPGDKQNTLETIRKIVSGSTPEVADFVAELYDSVLRNGICKASSIAVAEAAKVLENTQRDINIALMNEVCQIFHAMNINTIEVLKCASTKWNFVPVRPGLVGGHCISIDPYYLIHSAQEAKVSPNLILEARNINEGMGDFIAHAFMDKLAECNIDIKKAHILILGFAFKANCPDIRNTKVMNVYHTLSSHAYSVDIYDPLVDRRAVKEQYGIRLLTSPESLKHRFDAVILCVGHQEFLSMNLHDMVIEQGIVYDAMNVFPRADYYL